ncbi:hypothetical protein EDB86DRAFT_1370677 [Lactarius hatsudake]|nr:hypothetical protein EDB86DRAFT_1370677 [Lactarius hatsudake]
MVHTGKHEATGQMGTLGHHHSSHNLRSSTVTLLSQSLVVFIWHNQLGFSPYIPATQTLATHTPRCPFRVTVLICPHLLFCACAASPFTNSRRSILHLLQPCGIHARTPRSALSLFCNCTNHLPFITLTACSLSKTSARLGCALSSDFHVRSMVASTFIHFDRRVEAVWYFPRYLLMFQDIQKRHVPVSEQACASTFFSGPFCFSFLPAFLDGGPFWPHEPSN